MAKTDKPDRKPIAVIVRDRCPHCGTGVGYLKTRGCHQQVTDMAGGTMSKWFYVSCRSCEKPYLLKEVWPID